MCKNYKTIINWLLDESAFVLVLVVLCCRLGSVACDVYVFDIGNGATCVGPAEIFPVSRNFQTAESFAQIDSLLFPLVSRKPEP